MVGSLRISASIVFLRFLEELQVHDEIVNDDWKESGEGEGERWIRNMNVVVPFRTDIYSLNYLRGFVAIPKKSYYFWSVMTPDN